MLLTRLCYYYLHDAYVHLPLDMHTPVERSARVTRLMSPSRAMFIAAS